MTPIPTLLFNLLAQRRVVILPQLGTLRVEHTPPSVDPKTGALTVALNRVVFSKESGEGEALPEIIERELGLEWRQVKPSYLRWTMALKKESADGEMRIEGVGVIHADGTVTVAEALDRWLNPVEQKTIALTLLPPQKEKKVKNPKNKECSPRVAWVFFLVFILLVLLLAAYHCFKQGFFDFWPEPGEERTEMPAPPVITPVVPQAESVADTTTVDSIRPHLPRQETKPPLPPAAEPRGDSYYLIVGVYSNRENAQRFMLENGLTASQVELFEMKSGKFMVSVGRFEQKAGADQAMTQWKSKFPGVWVRKGRP